MGIGSHLALTGTAAMGVPRHLIPANVPYEQMPCGAVSLWTWALSRTPWAVSPTDRDWADRAIAHARAHGDAPALCVALASLADFLVPGSPEATRVFDELHALDNAGIAPMPRSAGPIAEAVHLSKLRDANGAIACLHRGLTHITQTGVRNGVWFVQSWLIGIKLAAGRTADVIADGLPLLEQMRGTRNEAALGICRRAVVTALLEQDDLDRARPLAQVGWRQAGRFAVLADAAWPTCWRCRPPRRQAARRGEAAGGGRCELGARRAAARCDHPWSRPARRIDRVRRALRRNVRVSPPRRRSPAQRGRRCDRVRRRGCLVSVAFVSPI